MVQGQIQTQIKNGFSDNFRSVYGYLTTPFQTNKTISLYGYLFRDANLSRNYGSEIDIHLHQQILPDHFFFNYKVGQYFSGSHSSLPSQLMMWLDFSLKLGSG